MSDERHARHEIPALQGQRGDYVDDASETMARLLPIDALCARHDIDIDGIVRLVDAVVESWDSERTHESVYYSVEYAMRAAAARRLARGES